MYVYCDFDISRLGQKQQKTGTECSRNCCLVTGDSVTIDRLRMGGASPLVKHDCRKEITSWVQKHLLMSALCSGSFDRHDITCTTQVAVCQ